MTKISMEAHKAFQRTVNPKMAEKDYLECCILDELFQDDYIAKNFVFAGGGSITKAYNISQRIGQDIDLACSEFEDLPDIHTSRQLNVFKRKFKAFVFDVLRPKINYIINQDQKFMIVTDREWRVLDNQEQFMSSPTLHLLYRSAYGTKLEMGRLCIEVIPRKYDASAITFRSVVPYSTNQPMGMIPTVRYEQTFWDKVFALHSFSQRGLPGFQHFVSRHYYDVAQMADRVDLHRTLGMLLDISAYQTKYTNKGLKQLSNPSEVKLIPNDDILCKLENDYNTMAAECLQNADSWRQIIQTLQKLNNDLKTL